jgi:hypothetical protein
MDLRNSLVGKIMKDTPTPELIKSVLDYQIYKGRPLWQRAILTFFGKRVLPEEQYELAQEILSERHECNQII